MEKIKKLRQQPTPVSRSQRNQHVDESQCSPQRLNQAVQQQLQVQAPTSNSRKRKNNSESIMPSIAHPLITKHSELNSTSSRSSASPSSSNTTSSLHCSTNLSDLHSIFNTLLIFSFYFDITLSPALEAYFSNSEQNLTQGNLLTRLHIALIRNQTLLQLFSRLISSQSIVVSTSSETLYSTFLEILQNQGIVFVIE